MYAFEPFVVDRGSRSHSYIVYENLYMNTVQGHHDGRRLLVTGNKRTSLNTQKTCMAEDVCVSKTCGKAYDHTSKNLPFTIDYDKIRNGDSTTFSFKVRCNEAAAPGCNDLQWQCHNFCNSLSCWNMSCAVSHIRKCIGALEDLEKI